MNERPILLVEDDLRLREALAETLRLADFEVITAGDGRAALELLETTGVAAVITDYQMKPMDGSALLARLRQRHPQLPVLMITAHGSIEHAVSSMMAGATDYLAKPFAAQALIEKLSRIVPRELPANGLVAHDPVTLEALELARLVAAADSTVLLSGESGTGKEVFARFIHSHSPRAGQPFVAINCAAIPDTMLEALLFGHEKGAFTGAHEARPGKFEQAQGGTLLLDEISEMPLALQAKLLRVLQEREVERIGARTAIPLDVRLLATTNQDLRKLVAAGRFREDLYYRLSVFPLRLPPLRQRRRDIASLAQHFIRDAWRAATPPPELTPEAVTALETYAWPGNVRELANLMQRAVILCNSRCITARDLRFETADAAPAAAPAMEPTAPTPAPDGRLQESLQSVEGQLIIEALQRGGNRKRAAEILGISPRTLRYKLARLRDSGIAVPGRGSAALAS
jgi:two-component system response regulator FlrC